MLSRLFDPADPAALLPLAPAGLAALLDQHSNPVLHPLLPISFVTFASWPFEHPVSVFFVVAVLACVGLGVGPGEEAVAVGDCSIFSSSVDILNPSRAPNHCKITKISSMKRKTI